MASRHALLPVFAGLLLIGSAPSQTVSSSIIGTLTDPGDAVVPGVEVLLKDQGTGRIRSFTTSAAGLFRFSDVPPAVYTITAKAQGFKSYLQTDINLAAAETRDLGRIQLTLGSLSEEVTVRAAATPVQTASGERSAVISFNQLEGITLRSRDLMAILGVLPGVTSTSAGEVTSQNSLSGVSVNGAGAGRVNFTVDGITDLDTGSNTATHFNPNMDSIAEVRVLTTNFQAEYGRMASGNISVITKGGSRQFHGTLWNTWRHEQLNAKSFFENFNNQPKSIYRYWVYGFGVGGPVYVPKIWNTSRSKLFFFVSQEHTRQRPATQVGYFNVPTALERSGDFSQSMDQNGRLIPLLDPGTRSPIPGNVIPKSLASSAGQAFLNFLPMPNRCGASGATSGCWTEADQTQIYRRNYRYMFTQEHPRRNDVVRVDFNPTSRLTTWARYINDYDYTRDSSGINLDLLDSQNQRTPFTRDLPFPGHGYGVGITYAMKASIVNEFIFGKSFNSWATYAHDPTQLDRARIGNPPHWFDENDPSFTNDRNLPRPGLSPGSQNFALYAPTFAFGGGSTVGQVNMNWALPNTIWNDLYSFADHITVVKGAHSFKSGFYYERTGKVQQANSGAYLGSYQFTSSSGMPQDTNNGYANAYVGNFARYSEGKRAIGNFWFTGIEFFVQDNWRVSRRLTLDLGARFYHLAPQENLNKNSAVFLQSAYDPAKAARLYAPFCTIAPPPGAACPASNRVARDAVTGNTTYPGLAGTFVPYTVGGYATPPNYFNGMIVADGSNPAVPLSLFRVPQLAPALRIGFAWNIFGDGKTVIRGGFGQFFNRGDGNQIMGYGAQPPVAFTRSAQFASIATIPSYASSAAVSPQNSGGITGRQKYEGLMNGSLNVQQNIGFATVLDAAYVFSLRRNILASRQVNAVPMYSQYNPAYFDPWSGNLYDNAAGRALDNIWFRPMAGVDEVTRSDFASSANYHSLQVSVRRGMKRGLSYGLAYTFSKIMSYTFTPAYPDVPFFKYRYYGPSYNGAPHVLGFNYIYQAPGLGKHFNVRPLGWITDNWTVSGITSWQSHGRIAVPGVSFTGTSTVNPAPNMTGSAEGARLFAIGDPALASDQVSFWRTFNWQAFQPPPPCSWTRQTTDCFGNAGSGSIISVPTFMNNWDMSLAKNVPLRGDRRALIFRAEFYNLPNHTQFSGVNNGIQFDLGSYQRWINGKGSLVQSNNQLGRFTSARNPRQIAMTLRLQF